MEHTTEQAIEGSENTPEYASQDGPENAEEIHSENAVGGNEDAQIGLRNEDETELVNSSQDGKPLVVFGESKPQKV
jgi:hypothetical protein